MRSSDRPAYAPPVPISAEHDLTAFDCGKSALTVWLRKRALASEGRTSRTYVVVTAGARIVYAYYSLATASVERTGLPGGLRRNSPDPVPAMLLGRLAVDQGHQGAGIGSAMLREAMTRTLDISRTAGVRLLIVHPIDDEAAEFYARYGFRPMGDGKAMFLPIETIIDAL